MIDLTCYRWWTIAKTETEAQIVIRQTRERNKALGLPADYRLPRV